MNIVTGILIISEHNRPAFIYGFTGRINYGKTYRIPGIGNEHRSLFHSGDIPDLIDKNAGACKCRLFMVIILI